MAVQDSKGLIRGAVGNLIFKVVDGKQIIQARPLNVKQSKKSKKSSKIFGLCSSQATEIRGKLKPWILGCCDGNVTARFLGACLRAFKSEVNNHLESPNIILADMNGLKGFEFNVSSPLSNFFDGSVSVFGEPDIGLRVKIPSFIPKESLRYPVQCQNVVFKIIAFHSTLGVKSSDVILQKEWIIEKDQNVHEEMIFDIDPIPTQGITMVLVQLLFFKNKSKVGKVFLSSKKLHPMQVVYAR